MKAMMPLLFATLLGLISVRQVSHHGDKRGFLLPGRVRELNGAVGTATCTKTNNYEVGFEEVSLLEGQRRGRQPDQHEISNQCHNHIRQHKVELLHRSRHPTELYAFVKCLGLPQTDEKNVLL